MKPKKYSGPLYWDQHAAFILVAGMIMGAGIAGSFEGWRLGVEIYPGNLQRVMLILGVVILVKAHKAAESKRLHDFEETQSDHSA